MGLGDLLLSNPNFYVRDLDSQLQGAICEIEVLRRSGLAKDVVGNQAGLAKRSGETG